MMHQSCINMVSNETFDSPESCDENIIRDKDHPILEQIFQEYGPFNYNAQCIENKDEPSTDDYKAPTADI